MITTNIGSFPKPDYVPILGRTRSDPTQNYTEFLAAPPPDAEERFDRATRAAVGDQVAAGIDIPTDGETRREHYIYYHLRHLRGFSFDTLTDKDMRGGSWRVRMPAGVTRLARVCCGYPAELDMPDYPKADAQAYFALAEALEAADHQFDLFSRQFCYDR